MTVTGKTVAENLATVPTLADRGAQDILFPLAKPLSPAGNHILMLQGNLATESAVLKLSGKQMEQFEGL